MSLPKIERNQAIAEAVAAGEPLKIIADRYGLSQPRISQIAKLTPPPTPLVVDDVRPTLVAIHTLLSTLLYK